MTVFYEPHPVSEERKAELRAQGFTVIDAAFQPDGYENPAEHGAEDPQTSAETPKRRGRPPKAQE